ncbi:MAG: 4Fe-4S dicluster domain-containing protein [bacterium]
MNEQAFIIERDRFLSWLEGLQEKFSLIGPVDQEGGPAFVRLQSVRDMNLHYSLTMMGPQVFLYRPEERLCTIRKKDHTYEIDIPQSVPPQVLIGVHSCDLHALQVLDEVFIRKSKVDRNYRLWRENTVVIGFHCPSVYPQCFCASMGTGPFFEPKRGYDFLLTDFGDSYLMETLGDRALEMIAPLQLRPATQDDFDKKSRIGRELEGQFTKKLDTTHLVEIIMRNQDHPVWRQTADSRCLGCTNCTKVCPTCFCYDVKDNINYDLTSCERIRHKDSCQELHFAEVYGGNFRASRMARLRQFVTHKLATWVEQLGCFGCVGCGRCMTWCPTKIDLSDMAKEIMATEKYMALDVAGKRRGE